MSGTNPFRRENIGIQNNDHDALEEGRNISSRAAIQLLPLTTDIPSTKKSKTGKTVRIISPHSASSDSEDPLDSNDLSYQRSLSNSPRQPTLAEGPGNEAPIDPFSAHPAEVKSSAKAVKVQQGDRLHNATSHSSDQTLPANLVKQPSATVGNVIAEEREPATILNTRSRPQFDVDDFKNLLLTGKKPSSDHLIGPSEVSFMDQPPMVNDNSNADTSSLSRQSLYKNTSMPLSESPLPSQNISIPDDDRQNPVAAPLGRGDRPKPATPVHRHGKLVTAKTPQTVSFEDPALSFANSTTTFAISPVDITNSETFSPVGTLHNAEIGSSITQFQPSDQNPNLRTQKKTAPAPPPSRRQVSSRPRSLIGEPNQSSSIREEEHTESDGLSQSSQPTNIKPAPPPPRRHGSFRADSRSSIPTISALSSTPEQFSRPRHPTSTPSTRSPVFSASNPSVASPEPGSPSMPPPPPPRRRGSSQSSYTPSRLSGDYRNFVAQQRSRGDSGASSISQFQMPAPSELSYTQPREDGKDALADLSALQREVDEFRGKLGR